MTRVWIANALYRRTILGTKRASRWHLQGYSGIFTAGQ